MPHNLEVTPHDHVHGSPDARITLIEYGDYECPHCGHAYWILKQLQQQFGDDVRFVYRHFPLTQIHPMAEPAAEAAEFAAANNKFWQMHNAIYENQEQLSPEVLIEIGEGLELDSRALVESLEEHRLLPRVREDFMSGVRSGVNGTPTFFLNGQRHNGSSDDLAAAIQSLLVRDRAA
jgi:protein-disulfide isomerase